MEVKLYYAPINNMGDDLNRLLMQKVFNQSVAKKFRVDNFDVMCIGSCLGACFYGQTKREKQIKLMGKKIFSKFSRTGHIWGTGFIEEYPFEHMKLIRQNIQFDMVRGELSRRGVSKILKKDLDIPLGDGGLLAPMLISEKEIIKNGKIGIIPHYREKNDPAVARLMNQFGDDAMLIDVQNDSIKVITEIASCEYIISSSLHGLIVADAFGIPNTRIKITNNLLGTSFKFDDYYSAFGIEKKPVVITDDKLDDKQLFDQPQVMKGSVLQIQNNLIQTMNLILNSLKENC